MYLIETIKLANDEVLKVYNTDFTHLSKDDKSPLTQADLNSNKIIIDRLEKLNKELNQDILIISEENQNLDYKQRKEYDLCWLVDPLDGTKEFIKKNGEFTTNIGLVKGNKPIFGIVGVPCKNTIYYGGPEYGSFEVINKITYKIRVKKFDDEDENLIIIGSKSHMNKETEDFINRYKNPQFISKGSSIKLLLVAKGDAHIYPRIAPTMEWDTCAADAIVRGAGGKTYQYNNGLEMVYNKVNLLNPFFVCQS
jgi:3'(2'), 5'-bisphosphate nucleotidase